MLRLIFLSRCRPPWRESRCGIYARMAGLDTGSTARIKAAYSPLGVLIALTFIGLRSCSTVQPVIEDLEPELEEAAAAWGQPLADLPPRAPSTALSALIMALRSLSRGRSRIRLSLFISGNMPMRTEITSLLIITSWNNTITRSHRHRRGDAGCLVHTAASHQPASEVEP